MRGRTWSAIVLTLAVLLTFHLTVSAQSRTITVGYGSIFGVRDVPSLMALERLEAQGYRTEAVEFAESELAVEAVLRGFVDISAATITAPLAAIQHGADIKFFVTQGRVEQALVAQDSIQQCADLHRARVGIHSWQSATIALVERYISENCPGTAPQYQVVPNSSVRAQSMLHGQIVASSVELMEVILLEDAGGFHVLSNYGDLALLNNVYFARPAYLANNGETIQDFIHALFGVHRDIYENPELLADAARRFLPEVDADDLPRIVEAYLSANIWPAEPVLSEQTLGSTIALYQSTGSVGDNVQAANVLDRTHLERAGF